MSRTSTKLVSVLSRTSAHQQSLLESSQVSCPVSHAAQAFQSSANAGCLPHKVEQNFSNMVLCVGVLLAIAASSALGYAWYCKRQSTHSRSSKQPTGKPLPWLSGHMNPAWSLCKSACSVSPSTGSADILHWQPSQFASSAQELDSSNQQSPLQSAWGSTHQSEDTAFFTSPIVTDMRASCLAEWQAVQSQQQIYSIPAPLWSEVEILPDHIDIAQTSTGKDWILGEGSFGTVRSGWESSFITSQSVLHWMYTPDFSVFRM